MLCSEEALWAVLSTQHCAEDNRSLMIWWLMQWFLLSSAQRAACGVAGYWMASLLQLLRLSNLKWQPHDVGLLETRGRLPPPRPRVLLLMQPSLQLGPVPGGVRQGRLRLSFYCR